MSPSKKTTNGWRAADSPYAKNPARLASFAIFRGQTAALRRHLAAGLDPDSLFHDGFSGPNPWPLIEGALMTDEFECCVVLQEAGATLTRRTFELAINHSGDDRYLRHLLDSGKLDPNGGPRPGVSWIDFADCEKTGASKSLLLQALCERERTALAAEPARSASTTPRRFL